MSSYSEFRDWTGDEEAEKASVRAIHIEIPKSIRDVAHRALMLHEDPLLVVANWMREETAKVVIHKMKEICDNLENAMPGFDSPAIVEQVVAAIRGTSHKIDKK